MLPVLLCAAIGGFCVYAYLTWLDTNWIPEKPHLVRDLGIVGLSMCTNFLLSVVLCIITLLTLNHDDRPVKINAELTQICILWAIAAGIFHACLLYDLDFQRDKKSEESTQNPIVGIFVVVPLIRNFVAFLISIVLPISKPFDESVDVCGESRECVNNVETVLVSEIAYVFFTSFVEEDYGQPGCNLVQFYTRVKLFEDLPEPPPHSIEQEDRIALIHAIMRDHILPDAPYLVDCITSEIREGLEQKLEVFPPQIDKLFFEPLYPVLLQQLQEYFRDFRQSSQYVQAVEALKRNELMYEKHISAELL